nr:hypothetical protein [Tanacetum cinerariifolium]
MGEVGITSEKTKPDEDSDSEVEEVEGHSMFQVTQKMKNLKKPLRKLLHDQGNLHDRVNRLRVELDLWLDVGDSNSAYFHKTVKSKNQRNRIVVITNSTNAVVTGNEVPGFEYKHDYTVIDSPRAVTFRDKYGVQMIMRFNEIHKFSNDTLHQIDEALDYRVNEFKVNRMNPGLNTRFWIRNDVERSKEFMFAIQKRLKTRRIFRNLESFVGGRVRNRDYRLLKRTE